MSGAIAEKNVTSQTLGDVLGLTARRVNQLVAEGWIRKSARNTIGLKVGIQGYLKHLEDRHSKALASTTDEEVGAERLGEILGLTVQRVNQLGVTSTPTEGNAETFVDEASGLEHWRVADDDAVGSPIWRLWQEGTRYEWAWPCPHCGIYFIPRFKLLRWPQAADTVEAVRKAWLECPIAGARCARRTRRP